MITPEEVEDFIRKAFYSNYELLKLESGSIALTPDTRDVALNQVLLYWRKLRDIAERITDTEVPIHLPNQISPQGIKYNIEGVVDVIREGDSTILYDIKTHDPDYVRDHSHQYAMQLNLYAYVWQKLRGEPLTSIAVIATAYTDEMQKLMRNGKLVSELSDDELRDLETAIHNWQPLVELDYSEIQVQDTIRQFGEVVDKIEQGAFEPPSLEILEGKWRDTGSTFARRVCRNCDARFSCGAYHEYAINNMASSSHMKQFVNMFFSDLGEPSEQEGWVASNLNATPEDAYLNALLGE